MNMVVDVIHTVRFWLWWIDKKTPGFRAPLAELMALVSWMLAAMRYQETVKTKQHRKHRSMWLHMTFPVRLLTLPMDCS